MSAHRARAVARAAWRLAAGLGLLAFAGCAVERPALEPASADLALVGCKVYPSPEETPLADATILIRGSRIAAAGPASEVRVPGGTETIPCGNGVVTAGFWNSHVHIMTPALMEADRQPAEKISAELEAMLGRWGFTTVFDIASVFGNTEAIRRRIASGEATGPRILTVGDPFFPEGGTPVYVRDFFARYHVPSDEVRTAGEAAARARRELREGADGVKIFSASFAIRRIVPMPRDIARAVVAEAHRAGKPAFAHPSNLEGIEIALDSGVDVLAHPAPLSGPWGPALIGRMKAAHIALTPTLTLFDAEAEREGIPPAAAQRLMDEAVAQVRAFASAGGEILFGTDVGYTSHYDTAEEYRLMSRAGMDFRAILASLTTRPARRFGDSARRGRVAMGQEADLVVLANDPASDVTAFSRVRATIRAGKVIYSGR
jgi:imidazolonepropionase-like amidohydrolase